MADRIAGAAVGAGVKFVLEYLQYHRNLIKGAEGEVRKLEEDLRLFQAFLKVTTKQRLEDDIWRVLVGRIRSVVNDSEDTIDTYVTKAAATNSRNCFGRAFRKPLFLHDIGTQVQSIVQEINTTYGKDKILEWATRNTDEIQRNHGPTKKPEGRRKVKRENIVGFTDESDEIIGYLLEKTEYLDVISIIGMPGLGKTTLASKISHHEKIQSEFPTRIWVYISTEFTEERVFLDILKQLMDLADEENQKKYKKLQESDSSVLVEEITTRLKDKKFLIVMDDVWTHEDWEKIQKALPMNNHAGKVLITSRKKEVSNAINRHIPSDKRHVLKPDPLNKEDSWLLLQYEAFGKPECPIELEDYGKEIVRKCDGLPLAIAIIGGLLGNKFSASDDMAQQKKAWKEVSGSVTTQLYDVDEEKYMKKIIALSYDDLPYHLRACFLYLGMFPEDFEIPAWKLICMWIAEGFIEHKNDLSLEGVAEIYLVELISRNLVKAEKIRSDGRVRTCCIHDMLREFCIHEAGREDENFFHEVKRIREEQKCRRICTDHIITSSSLKFLGPRVRTFVCFSKEHVILPKENNSAIPTDLELLRVLEAESIKLERIPKEMYQLLHLRYLTLSVVNLRVIPETLSELWNLETFIVHTEDRWEGVEMKADVWKLRQLRHLKTNSAISFPEARKSGGTEGKKLQTLGTISAESCTEEVFNRACNLKELVISGAVNSEGYKNLGKLDSLEKLKLFGATDIGIGRLPPDPFPPNLKSLTLGGTGLDWDADIHILGLLENLEVLKLKVGSFTKGRRWKAKDGAFRRLEVLHIDCNCLEVWEASGHHYPRLRHLRLHDIAYSSLEVPMGLAAIPNFRVMEFSGYYREEKIVAAKKFEEAKKQKLGEHNVKDGAFKLLLTGKLETRREGATSATVEAAAAAVKLMQENLEQVVQYHSNLIKGAAREFRKLKEVLHLFQAFLNKSAKHRLQDNTTRDLVDRIRNVL